MSAASVWAPARGGVLGDRAQRAVDADRQRLSIVLAVAILVVSP